MELHNILSLKATNEENVYIAHVDITDINDERYTCDYVIHSSDNYGLASVIRDAAIQWISDGKPIDPPDPEVQYVPEYISRRQFYQGLAVAEKITKNEAIAAISSGAIPSAIQTILDNMEDEDTKFEATMLLIGATEFNRNHPLVMIFAISQGMSEQDVDNFWLMCSEL